MSIEIMINACIGRQLRRLSVLGAVMLAVFCVNWTARADELPTVRVGKAQAVAFAFVPLEIGEAAGIWQQVGIKLEISALRGDAQVQQALASGSIDIGLGSGPGLGFLAKGVPALGVAAMAGAPYSMAMVIGPNSPIKTIADFKGKRVAVTTPGSLTEWLAKQIAVREGWPTSSITTVPLGDTKSMMAALETGSVVGMVSAVEAGYQLQEKGEGRPFIDFGNIVENFHTHIIFARQDLIDNHPDIVEKFLKGWFRSVAYMRDHREKAIEIAAKVEDISKPAMSEVYGATMQMMSADGSFNPAALKHLSQSFVELGILPTQPDMSKLITTKFVPVKY